MKRSLSVLVLLVALAGAPSSFGHAERPSFYPVPSGRHVPKLRAPSLKGLVVCQPSSRARIARDVKGAKLRRHDLALLARCSFNSIQAAVNAAHNGSRIQILPGVYTEPQSRKVPFPDPKCASLMVDEAGPRRPDQTVRKAPSYEYHLCSPNSANLIAILGDSKDPDRRCDHKCDLSIEGAGDDPKDVIIAGDGHHPNVIKADRADGIVLRNFTAQFADFNDVYVHETDGFRLDHLVLRWTREYGALSFTSDHGLYEHIDASGAGDSGIYPGSGPQTEHGRYGIVIRHTNLHDNLQGTASAAGDNLLWEDNRIHHNGAGFVTDSFSPGHPGMPQHHQAWIRNKIYSNNRDDFFSAKRDEYCKKPAAERSLKVVCPAIMVPTGTGVVIAGGNDNLVEGNQIYDNWRNGVMQFWVEAAFRADYAGSDQQDTSHFNQSLSNVMGIGPGGKRLPNGHDFWWDEEGQGNCWRGNIAADGAAITSDPATLPNCPGASDIQPVNPVKHSFLVPCATWDPQNNTDPPGCDWLVTPPKPGSSAGRAARVGARFVAPCRALADATGCQGAPPAPIAGPLRWVTRPMVYRHPTLAHDLVAVGVVENTSLAPLSLRGADIRVTAAGRARRTAAAFAAGYAPVVHLWNRQLPPPDYDLQRVGKLVTLAPGQCVPLTVAWRGTAQAPRVDYGLGALALSPLRE